MRQIYLSDITVHILQGNSYSAGLEDLSLGLAPALSDYAITLPLDQQDLHTWESDHCYRWPEHGDLLAFFALSNQFPGKPLDQGDISKDALINCLKARSPVMTATGTLVVIAPFEIPVSSIKITFNIVGISPEISNVRNIDLQDTSQDLKTSVDIELVLNQLDVLNVWLRSNFRRTGSLQEVEEAITILFIAADIAHIDIRKAEYLSNLGRLHYILLQRTHDFRELDEVISAHRRAVSALPGSYGDISAFLDDLAGSLELRISYRNDPADVEEARSTWEKSVDFSYKNDENLPYRLAHLEKLLTRSNDIQSLPHAIETQKKVVALTPNTDFILPDRIFKLGKLYRNAYDIGHRDVDLNEAISAMRESIRLTPSDHPKNPSHLMDLAAALSVRFDTVGNSEDINETIDLRKKVIEMTSDDSDLGELSYRMSLLGTSLKDRFEKSGGLEDILEAIEVQQMSITLVSEESLFFTMVNSNAAISFFRRFEHSGRISDLEEAISLQRRTLQALGEGSSSHPGNYSNLGNYVMRRYEQKGNLADLEEAISFHQKALLLAGDSHPTFLNNLGISHRTRFERTGNFKDIEESISMQRRVIQLTPNEHPKKGMYWNNLGHSYQHRFKHTSRVEDIDEAISIYRTATKILPNGHAQLPGLMNNLGNSLGLRFRHAGDIGDIQEAIGFLRKALDITPEGFAELPVFLDHLGMLLHLLAEKTKVKKDLDEAISVLQKSIELTPGGHADIPKRLIRLGDILSLRFDIMKDSPLDADKAIDSFRRAADYLLGPPSIRLQAARKWATMCCRVKPEESIDAYTMAFQLLPQVVWIGQTISDRRSQLVSISDLASESAAIAISLGELEKAVEWLEQGRAIVWMQLNNLRTPLDALRDVDEVLAEDLRRVSNDLEKAGGRNDNVDISSSIAEKILLQDQVREHQNLTNEWDTLLSKVRAIPGFEDFLAPVKFSKISSTKLSELGPVVIINIHPIRCDALILGYSEGQVTHTQLPKMSYEKAHKLRQDLKAFLIENSIQTRKARAGRPVAKDTTKGHIRSILAILWDSVVRPIIERLALSITTNPTRIWWSPTGPLAFLPVHAAGNYDANATPGSTVADYVISSYTPNIGMLLTKLNESANSCGKFTGLLAVSQPDTPGLPPIPQTTEETRRIEEIFAINSLKVELKNGAEATVETVSGAMMRHSWVHLACHAIQDQNDPTKSAFYLHNGQLTLAEIIKKSLPQAEFAFLSACETATGDRKLSEEALHLGAGMLAAGYRSAVATMWSIDDGYAAEISKEVYSSLLNGRSAEYAPDARASARALHNAIQEVRKQLADSDTSLLFLVPYIHIGL